MLIDKINKKRLKNEEHLHRIELELRLIQDSELESLFEACQRINDELRSSYIHLAFCAPFNYLSISYLMGLIEYDPFEMGISLDQIFSNKGLGDDFHIRIPFGKYHNIIELFENEFGTLSINSGVKDHYVNFVQYYLGDAENNDLRMVVSVSEELGKLASYVYNMKSRKEFTIDSNDLQETAFKIANDWQEERRDHYRIINGNVENYDQPVSINSNRFPFLKETKGVLLYKEQKDKLIQSMTGTSIEEAIELRRHFGVKRLKELEKFKGLIKEKQQLSFTDNDADEIFEYLLLSQFGNYEQAYIYSLALEKMKLKHYQ